MVSSLHNIVELVKQAALEAMEASKPAAILYGKVLSVTPLKIQIDQKTIYTNKMLVLTRNVTDYEIDITVSWTTEFISHNHPVHDTYTGGGSSDNISHDHPITGRKKIKIHNALKTGDIVVLVRQQGGKKFLVVDRLGKGVSS